MEEMLKRLLPVGSVVSLKNTSKKMVIMGIMQMQQEKEKIYDYIGVTYPEGFASLTSCFLFQHDEINQIIFRGYEDDERKLSMAYLATIIERATETIINNSN